MVDPQFVQFYDAYPLHKARKAAEKAWHKLKPDAELFARIIAAVERYKATKPEGQSYANPATWLNGERWEDDPTPIAGAGATAMTQIPPCRAPSKFEIDHGHWNASTGFALDATGKIITDRLCADLACEHCKPRRTEVA